MDHCWLICANTSLAIQEVEVAAGASLPEPKSLQPVSAPFLGVAQTFAKSRTTRLRDPDETFGIWLMDQINRSQSPDPASDEEWLNAPMRKPVATREQQAEATSPSPSAEEALVMLYIYIYTHTLKMYMRVPRTFVQFIHFICYFTCIYV